MTSDSIHHDGPLTRPAPETAGRLAAIFLILLVAFLPITRVAVQLLLPSGGATAMARLQVGIMELLFIATVLLDRRLIIPSPAVLPRMVRVLAVAWLAWSLVAIAQSAVPATAMARQTEWLLHGAFGWTVWAYLNGHEHRMENVLRWLVRGFLIYVVLLSFFLMNLPNPREFPWVNGILGFANVRHFGYYAGIVLVAAHLPLLRDAAKGERLGQILVLSVVWGFLAWSGSRGPIFALLGSLFVLSVFRIIPHPRRLWGWTALAAVIGALISIPFTPPHGSFGIIRFAETIHEADGLAQYSAGRMEFWSTALRLVTDHPLFGLGPDQMLVGGIAGRFWSYVQPHDLMLQAALEWGIPGALMFLGLLAIALLAGLRRRVSGHGLIGFWIVLMLTALSLIDGTYYHALPLMGLAFGLALTFTSPKTETSDPDHRPLALATLAGACGLMTGLSATVFWAVLASGTPTPESWRVRAVHFYPSTFAMLGGGSRLDNWARAWAAQDTSAAYALLDWTAERSRMPWTSLKTKAEIMITMGEEKEGHELLEAAQTRELAVTGELKTADNED